MQFYVSNFVGPELTDILSALSCIGSMVLVLKFWKPRTIFRLEGDTPAIETPHRHTAGQLFAAWLPYLLLVLFVVTWGEASVKKAIDAFTNGMLPASLPKSPTTLNGLTVPGLHNLIMRVPPVVPARRHPTPRSTPSIG